MMMEIGMHSKWLAKMVHGFSATLIMFGTLGGLAWSPPSSVKAETKTKQQTERNEGIINVSAKDFLERFHLNGSATYKYDEKSDTGIVTLTEDVKEQAGNFTLKDRIDLDKSFELTGSVNLGSDSKTTGADGIGFAFHPGDTKAVGYRGANMGIGGLQNAIGFQLDTFHNSYSAPDPNGAYPNYQLGWEADPNVNPYGAFVTTDGEKGWATIDTDTVQKFDGPKNIDGKFRPFKISYDGKTRLLTVQYDAAEGAKYWTYTIPKGEQYQQMAMAVSASTGGSKNKHQYKFDNFKYESWSGINVRYVREDKDGYHDIADPESMSGPDGQEYKTEQKDIAGYRFKEMGKDSLPAAGIYSGTGGTVIYVYESTQLDSAGVKVIHKTEDGKILKTENATYGKDSSGNPLPPIVGNQYFTQQGTFDGYVFVKVDEGGWAPTGFLEKDEGIVTYIYRDKNAPETAMPVTVNHVDKSTGNLLKEEMATFPDGLFVGQRYTSEIGKFPGFKYVGIDENGLKPEGILDNKGGAVTYYYEPEPESAGEVKVHYQTEDGKLLGNADADYPDGQHVGKQYTTKQKAFDGYEFVKVDEEKGLAATGTLTPDDGDVYYIYKEVKPDPEPAGEVKVHYQTEDGKTLGSADADYPDGQHVGKQYTTKQKAFDGYEFVKVDEEKGLAATGTLTADGGDVYYIYKVVEPTPEPAGKVTVHYQTEDGQSLGSTMASYPDGQHVGKQYTTEKRDFDGYEFVKVDEGKGLAANGTLTADDGDVYYIYKEVEPIPEPAGKVMVRYVTDDAEPKELKDSEEAEYLDEQVVGGRYQTIKYTFEGYSFKEVSSDGLPVSSYLTAEGGTVTYVYSKEDDPAKCGRVHVTHQTVDGEKLDSHEADYPNGQAVGERYEASPRDFRPLTYLFMTEDSAPATGTLEENDKQVTFVYGDADDNLPNVKVEYKTEDGDLLGNAVATYPEGQEVGKPYQTNQRDFDGYSFVRVDAAGLAANGDIPEGGGMVIYLYQANPTDPTPGEPDPDPTDPEPSPVPDPKPDPEPTPEPSDPTEPSNPGDESSSGSSESGNSSSNTDSSDTESNGNDVNSGSNTGGGNGNTSNSDSSSVNSDGTGTTTSESSTTGNQNADTGKENSNNQQQTTTGNTNTDNQLTNGQSQNYPVTDVLGEVQRSGMVSEETSAEQSTPSAEEATATHDSGQALAGNQPAMAQIDPGEPATKSSAKKDSGDLPFVGQRTEALVTIGVLALLVTFTGFYMFQKRSKK
ncbi:MucBP domain-containing protein [Furfurilactobacillus milii]|nr:MucBP domain-containing protein [Furfurilactobacillus milii]